MDYLQELLDNEEAMAESINVEAFPSPDEACWKMHQANIMNLKRVISKYKAMLSMLQVVSKHRHTQPPYEAIEELIKLVSES